MPIQTWELQPNKLNPINTQTFEKAEVLKLDRAAFGYDRSHILHHLIKEEHVFSDQSGFAIASLCAGSLRIGPWVHSDPQGAEKLMKSACSISNGHPVRVITQHGHPHAAKILEQLGFEEVVNPHVRMVLGTPPKEHPTNYYSLLGMVTG